MWKQEVNFLWAQHQIHHSSEDFNIAVAVRHPITHGWINSVSLSITQFFLHVYIHIALSLNFSNLYNIW